MIRRILIEMSIWTRVNLRSPLFLGCIISVWLAVIVFMRLLSSERDAISGIYEQAGMLLFVLAMASAFSLDIDSRFMEQLRTYPVRQWELLFERAFIGYSVGTLYIVILVMFFLPNIQFMYHLRYLLFMLPVYWSFGALTMLGTILVRHTIGGILLAFVMWAIAMGRTMGELSPIILHFTNVDLSVSYWGVDPQISFETWLILNRLFFAGLGLISWTLSWLAFTHWKRK
ncbi:hypothetical protein ACK8P5_13010 [Paenibacillus sp. EC2-1]|uniref:hypothetical protein n=1 Tax=Paenibacillus sp. EC2-1 TaxID=3388665 RepID=UPI003BEF31E2